MQACVDASLYMQACKEQLESQAGEGHPPNPKGAIGPKGVKGVFCVGPPRDILVEIIKKARNNRGAHPALSDPSQILSDLGQKSNFF